MRASSATRVGCLMRWRSTTPLRKAFGRPGPGMRISSKYRRAIVGSNSCGGSRVKWRCRYPAALLKFFFTAQSTPPTRVTRKKSMKQAMVKRAPSPVDKHVGSCVRMRRMMLGMSREKLGDDLGLTWQQVQKYENGKNPSARALAAHLAYPANPGAVLLRRRTAATGAARGDWTGAVARLCV